MIIVLTANVSATRTLTALLGLSKILSIESRALFFQLSLSRRWFFSLLSALLFPLTGGQYGTTFAFLKYILKADSFSEV